MKQKPLRNIRQVTGALTARQAHDAMPRPVHGAPRPAPVRASRYIHTLQTWLRARTARGWDRQWLHVGDLADLASADMDMKVTKTAIGRAILLEFPHAEKRIIRETVSVGPWERSRLYTQYNTQSFRTKPLDPDTES